MDAILKALSKVMTENRRNTLQRRYNAGDGSHKIEPRYKWYRAITT